MSYHSQYHQYSGGSQQGYSSQGYQGYNGSGGYSTYQGGNQGYTENNNQGYTGNQGYSGNQGYTAENQSTQPVTSYPNANQYSSYQQQPTSYQQQPTTYQQQLTSYQQQPTSYQQQQPTATSYQQQPTATNYQQQPATSTHTPTYNLPPSIHTTGRKFPPAPYADKRKKPTAPRRTFPVSSGTHHKKSCEGFVPKRTKSIPPYVVSRLALAKSKLEINPNDHAAQNELADAMADYHAYQEQRESDAMATAQQQMMTTGYTGPGLFTGEALVAPMDKSELESNDERTFARPDMFLNLKPLKENFGKELMRKYGWREGKPLGTSGVGSLAPIELTVKINRRGLMGEMEQVRRKPEGVNKNEGPAWICKVVNQKNSVSGLSELHQVMGIPTPVFKLVSTTVGAFRWSVSTNWGNFTTPGDGNRSKKLAKTECAYNALREILEMEANRLGVEPPTAAAESAPAMAVFVPSNRTCGGKRLLYKHFYKAGNLVNLLERAEWVEWGEGCDYDDTPAPPSPPSPPPEPSKPSTATVSSSSTTTAGSTTTADSNERSSSTGAKSINKNSSVLGAGHWMLDAVNGRNACNALLVLCERMFNGSPEEYTQYMKGEHYITVTTPWGSYTPPPCKSKGAVRMRASHMAVRDILRQEAARTGRKPPRERPESTDNVLHFSL